MKRARTDITADPRLAGAYKDLDKALVVAQMTHRLSYVETTALVGETLGVRLGHHIAERRPGAFDAHVEAASAIVARAVDRASALANGPPPVQHATQHEAITHIDGIIAAYRGVVSSLVECRSAMREGDQTAASEAMEQAHAAMISGQTQIVLAEKSMIEWAAAHV